VISSALTALAEDPEFFVEPPEGSQRLADDRYCVIVGPHGRWAGVCRLRLPPPPDELAQTVAEIRQLVAGVDLVIWNVGSSATPEALPDRLRELGLRDPDPPMDAVCAAMALGQEPPGVDGVDVRRIETLAEHRAGLEIMLAAASWTESAAAAERARAEETYARRTRRGGYQWLAWLGSKPVAFGLADRTTAGLFLAGGSTLPEARGRGCYRALVRARWDEAVRLGTPGLAVQAQYGTSAPILRKLGFSEVATVHTLQ
jgi:GNAT superfamily N-acetyltransferase